MSLILSSDYGPLSLCSKLTTCVIVESEVTRLDSPQSAILPICSAVIKMLVDFRSRWTIGTGNECMYDIARAQPNKILSPTSSVNQSSFIAL